MKKLISSMFLALSLGVFWGYSLYTEGSFDYHVAQFIGYFFYWSAVLFTISLFAFMLDEIKYKWWLLVTSIYVAFSILIAYLAGDSNGAIISFDGKDLTLLFAGGYSLVSIIYFTIQFSKKRKNQVGV